jgi:hypothetical protein
MTQTLNLIEHLKQIPDYRKSKARRHSLWLLLMLVLLGTLCGYRCRRLRPCCNANGMVKTLIWVERWGIRAGQPFEEPIGYISDLELNAVPFLQQIQQHWTIETRLHWVRDVTFDEDYARPGGKALVMWAILNCFLISIVRQLAYCTIPQKLRVLTNQVHQV